MAPNITVGSIIQLSLHDDLSSKIDALIQAAGLPQHAVPLQREARHVTLAKLTPQQRKLLQSKLESGAMRLPLGPFVDLLPTIHHVTRPATPQRPAREAWILVVRDQSWLRVIVGRIAEDAGIELSGYEEQRPFHVSIANLTGSPFDSVGDVQWSDIQGLTTAPDPTIDGLRRFNVGVDERDAERVEAVLARWNEDASTQMTLTELVQRLFILGLEKAEDEIRYQDDVAAMHDDSDIPF
jgi:hypothetical protein